MCLLDLEKTYAAGESEVILCFDPVVASAFLVKIDGVINEEHRDSRDKASKIPRARP